ncbi:MAG: DUF4436 family protein [Acidobacteria bacterium]|nr:DUF4436 family protein [Acidobacteriota bacterium]
MSASDKASAKEFIAAIIILAVMMIGIYFTLGVFSRESEQHEIQVSEAGSKSPDHVEVVVKLISVDPIKGDASARLEFTPHGKLAAEDSTPTTDLKAFLPFANNKTEVDFKKGKVITPVDVTFSLYGGNAADYPLDNYETSFSIYIERASPEKKETPKDTAKESAKSAAGDAEHETTQAEPPSNEIPLDVSFFGSIPGYKIAVAKDKETDETYVGGDVTIQRSGMVIAFSTFVGILMWGLSLAVLFLVLSVVLRGRKAELAMFSFMSALLFAYYAVRNSQPNVPPIGVFSDFVAFFWAEILVAFCLLATVFTWVFRAAK